MLPLRQREGAEMLVVGDIQCLHCGFESGRWRGPRDARPSWSGFQPYEKHPAPKEADQAIHCLRCQGPVMLINIEPVVTAQRLRRIQRLRDELADLQARAERRARRRGAAA
jgi:hypothetical protein